MCWEITANSCQKAVKSMQASFIYTLRALFVFFLFFWKMEKKSFFLSQFLFVFFLCFFFLHRHLRFWFWKIPLRISLVTKNCHYICGICLSCFGYLLILREPLYFAEKTVFFSFLNFYQTKRHPHLRNLTISSLLDFSIQSFEYLSWQFIFMFNISFA